LERLDDERSPPGLVQRIQNDVRNLSAERSLPRGNVNPRDLLRI
jgi:hypothetical protein